MRAFISIAIVWSVLLGGNIPRDASADLGVSLDRAQNVAARHATRHGGIDPLFEVDKDGVVVWECWAAPAREWSQDEAMALALDLVPPKLKGERPNRSTSKNHRSTDEVYVFKDGTAIRLQGKTFLLRRGMRNYIGVEVRAVTYRGPWC